MVRLSHPPQIQHFSHPHALNLNIVVDEQQPSSTSLCSCCKQQPSGYMYSCTTCNFTLHVKCSKLPQLITHPCHTSHNLTLYPVSAYSGGLFSCDACGRQGSGFSYHCDSCDYDLHVDCACLQLSINHQRHPAHALQLTFQSPYENGGFSCDICRRVVTHQWLYRCSSCEFDVHLDCATTLPREVQVQGQQLQHHHSFPTVSRSQVQLQTPPPQGIYNIQAARPNHLVHSASVGSLPLHQQPGYHHHPAAATMTPAANGPRPNSLLNAAMHGIIEGTCEQVASTVVQNILSGITTGNDVGGADPSSVFLSEV